MGRKIAGVPTLGILGLPLGSPGTKWHLGAGPMTRHKVYYRGEGGGFPKSELWWILWICVCLWFIYAPKCSNYALTNLLFGLCRFVWAIDLLVNLPSPNLGALTCPSTPKMLWAKKRAPTHSPFVVFAFGLVIKSIKELGGASHCLCYRHFYFFLNKIKYLIVSRRTKNSSQPLPFIKSFYLNNYFFCILTILYFLFS
jgi:hypothetical protein